MITVTKALNIIKAHPGKFGTMRLPLAKSTGHLLAEEWYSDRPLPPYDRISMDGIAIRYADYEAGKREFPIVGITGAGMPPQTLSKSGTCLEAMTGAILPINADTIIPYEHLTIADQVAKVNELVKPQQNVHTKGKDRDAGELLVRRGSLISAAEIGVGASIGRAEVEVYRYPSVVVISTGDELVPVDTQPLAHQIRRSNVHNLAAALAAQHIPADTTHLPDDVAVLRKELGTLLQKYDCLLLSGGVSKGKFDYLPQVLQELGVQQLFHRVQQRPGKPLWFGQHANGCTVFGFPGNPISSFACYHRYFRTWLAYSLQGYMKPLYKAVLTHEVAFKPDLTYFMEVKLQYSDEGQLQATPQRGNGSGDLANLVDADAFIVLPQGRDLYAAGEVFEVMMYRK